MLALHAQIDRVRAERLLDAAQAASYPHLGKGAGRFIDALIERCRATITDAADGFERVVWNGAVMRGSRAIKGKVVEAFGRGAAA